MTRPNASQRRRPRRQQNSKGYGTAAAEMLKRHRRLEQAGGSDATVKEQIAPSPMLSPSAVHLTATRSVRTAASIGIDKELVSDSLTQRSMRFNSRYKCTKS